MPSAGICTIQVYWSTSYVNHYSASTFHGRVVQCGVCRYTIFAKFHLLERVCRYQKIADLSPIDTYQAKFPNPEGKQSRFN